MYISFIIILFKRRELANGNANFMV